MPPHRGGPSIGGVTSNGPPLGDLSKVGDAMNSGKCLGLLIPPVYA